MKITTKALTGLATVALVGSAVTVGLAQDGPKERPGEMPGRWQIEATDARIIGGYGHNFAYDGENVRPLEGTARMTLDTEAGTGELEINIRTTAESGPLHFSKDQSWSGDIRIVQKLNTNQMDAARIVEEAWLHGDTGNEAPVMPKLFNYFATWGPSTIWVNGEEVVPMIGSHTMFSEESRNAAGKIVNAAGEVYTPMKQDKTGYTNPDETEFHYVAHTTQPDSDNFPPHTAWLHLHFSDVQVDQKPAGVAIPYSDTGTYGTDMR
ncbi:MAG: hypothetical protein RQ745_07950 [Longimicrobiales bacterium]|nr:hypothetical protein [Longimicrobiales bacterium]